MLLASLSLLFIALHTDVAESPVKLMRGDIDQASYNLAVKKERLGNDLFNLNRVYVNTLCKETFLTVLYGAWSHFVTYFG